MFDGKVASLYWETNSDWYAELLVERLQNKLTEVVTAIREEEYNRGWKEAKAKKGRKEEWFHPALRRVHT